MIKNNTQKYTTKYKELNKCIQKRQLEGYRIWVAGQLTTTWLTVNHCCLSSCLNKVSLVINLVSSWALWLSMAVSEFPGKNGIWNQFRITNCSLAAAPWRDRSMSEGDLWEEASALEACGMNLFECTLFLQHETQQVWKQWTELVLNKYLLIHVFSLWGLGLPC